MINLDEYEIFRSHKSTLKNTSYDAHGSPKYMTDSELDVVDFDAVKEEYAKSLRLSEIPKSNDAVFDSGLGAPVFLEFKNGFIDQKTAFDLQKKIYDSVLIFSDITSCTVSELRKIAEYILVYNEDDNIDNKDSELKIKTQVQSSPAYVGFLKTIARYANDEYIGFGLRRFSKYCFKAVHTFTRNEFAIYLETL